MGCDIHLHVEIKVDGEWEHWTAPHIDRDYSLFTKMAGVRSVEDVTPISLPKGLPTDITLPTSLDWTWWEADGHSTSWLDREELKELQQWWEEYNGGSWNKKGQSFETAIMGGYLNGDGYTHDLPEDVEDVRIIFWFDN